MKLVFVSYDYWPPAFGGELLISIERFHSLAARGWEVTVLTAGCPDLPRAQRDGGLEIRRSPVIGKRRILRLVRRLVFWLWALGQLSRLDYAALHLGGMPGLGPVTSALAAQSFCRIAARRGASSVIVHSLADSETQGLENRGWSGFWRRAFFGGAKRIVAVSPALHQSLVPYFPSRVALIPYAVRDDIFTADLTARQDLRSRHALQDSDTAFLFLGSVGRRKGFDLLAQAFAELALQYPGWRLWVLGPYTRAENQNLNEAEIAEISRPLQSLGDRVKFWGRVDDRQALSKLLAAGDIFVFPTRREGMPIAPLEAMAVGLPVIISRLSGITDLANIEGTTGLYVPPGDLDALKSAMQQLGADAAQRRAMGARAAERIRQDFGWQRYIATWADLYAAKGRADE